AKDGNRSRWMCPEQVIRAQVTELREQLEGIVLRKDILQLLRCLLQKMIESPQILRGRRLGQQCGHVERNARWSLVGQQFLEIFGAERSHKVLLECLMRM